MPSVKTYSRQMTHHQCLVHCGLTAVAKFGAGQFQDAREHFERFQVLLAATCGEDSYSAAEIHCTIAMCIEQQSGRPARRDYLQAAARNCHVLKSVPTLSGRRRLNEACMNPLRAQYANALWTTLLDFRVTDEIDDYGVVDRATLKAALALINFYRQEQNLALKHMSQAQSSPQNVHFERDIWTAGQLNLWSSVAAQEDAIWIRLEMHGHFLRLAVKRLPVVVSGLCISLGLSQSSYLDGQFGGLSSDTELLLRRLICSSSFVGHFFLAVELCGKLVENFPSTHNATLSSIKNGKQGDNKKVVMPLTNEKTSSRDNIQQINLLFQLSKEIYHLHDKMDFEAAIESFLKLFEEPVWLRPWRYLGNIVLEYIVCLSSLLGGASAVRALTTIRVWNDETSTCSSWKLALKDSVQEISWQIWQSELPTICSHFQESRTALKMDDYPSARCFSLKCWKVIARFSANTRPQSKELQLLTMSILLEVARILQLLYAENGSFTVAEWFCAFRFYAARSAKRYFSAAKHGMEYVEFLKTRNHWSKAAEQCRLVWHILEAHFGVDYAEWLPDAPQAATMLQLLNHAEITE